MNLYKFITPEEIKTVSESIKNKSDFEIKRKHKGYRFDISSSRAGADFRDGTKKSDYIVCIGFETNKSGWGCPMSGKELKELENADNLKRYIDGRLSRSQIEGYKKIGSEGQISLFE